MINILIDDNHALKRFSIVSYLNYKAIEIYLKQNNYFITLKDGYFFDDKTKVKQLTINHYEIKCSDNFYGLKLYVYDNFKGIDKYKLYKNNDLIISSHKNSSIVTNDPYLSNYYLCIKDKVINTNFDVVVNSAKYNSEPLKDGDIIEYLGLRIIYNDYFLYINDFNNTNNIEELNPDEKIIKFKRECKQINYSLSSKTKKIVIPELIEYVPYQMKDNSDLYKTIIPNLIMSLSIGLMSLNSFLSPNNNRISKIAIIASLTAMMMTSIILPIIFSYIEKRKDNNNASLIKKEYLNYLDAYIKEIKELIRIHVNDMDTHYYSLINKHDELFYISNKADDFLTLSLGRYTFSLNVDYKLINDVDIDSKIKEISKLVNNIDDYPLILDLKKYTVITICTKKSKKLYYLNKFIVEICYKYHYDDINIGIYSKDIRIIDDFYNLPHLFLNDERLTFSSYRKLQLLNQKKLNKPLVLFILDKCEYKFTNEMIKVVYITTSQKDLYPFTDVLIEYLNNNYLYIDNKISFKYYEEIIDFNKSYEYVSSFISFNNKRSYSFDNVFNIEDLERYYLLPQKGLEANFAFCNDELLSFDLDESKQGPHGLIGGSTGSGKSELIISLLLSLCVKYSPDYLNIILIDYKGGGIKESLSYNNETIPHIVASLTNLEANSLERLIIAIQNECKLRQTYFKELSNKVNLSIMNLDDYLKSDLIRYSMPKLAHLLIVVDEFAELKKSNPEQIKELISLSRIGRSLGIHLILATQKPNGVIDDEIFSNSRFKIALKVFEEKDSNDLIKCKDAAYLNQAGEFYLNVDSNLIKAKSIYSKNDIYGNDPFEVDVLDESLNKVDSNSLSITSSLSLCSYYSKKIIEVSKSLDKQVRQFKYKQNIPIKRAYKELILGESDDYINSVNELIKYDCKDSILIYSLNTSLVSNILNYLNEVERITIVIASSKYTNEYISDSLLYSDEDDIVYILNYLLTNINIDVSLVIEDLFVLLSYGDFYAELLYKLAQRKNDHLSLFFITSNSSINLKLINSFNNKLVFGAESADITNIFSLRTRYVGNNFFYKDELIPFVPCINETFNEKTRKVDSMIKKIPDNIEGCINDKGYLLGYCLKDKNEVYFNDDLLICSYREELINRYKKVYGDVFKICSYENNLANDYYPNILWLGGGLYSQRLFMYNLKNDLDENEGILITGNKKVVLRILNE